MKNILILVLILTSCSSLDKKIFKSEHGNYLTTKEGDFVKVNYNIVNELNPNSKYTISIINNSDSSLFIFSTVLENSEMFYSKNNFHSKKEKVIFDSYYNNYMKDALHSGVKKFNFIEILPNKILKINIDESIISGKENIELKYYYFYDDYKKELLNISDEKLKSKTITLNISL